MLQFEDEKYKRQAARIEELEQQVRAMRQEVREARVNMANYDRQIREQKETQDAETMMRIRFESKMTYLHS